MCNQPNKQDSTESTLKSINLVCWGSRLLSALTPTVHKRWESCVHLFQSPCNQTCSETKVVSFPFPTRVPFISLSYLQSKKKKCHELHCHANDCLNVHYLSGYLLCTKMVYLECKPGTVNTVLTMLGSHPLSSPFSEQSFCADSIFLLMLLNRWLQWAGGENLWNKQMPPEITIKSMVICVGRGKITL